MNAHQLTVAVLTGLSLASGAALAQQAAPKQSASDMKAAIEDKFRQLDADGDGMLTKAEAEKMKGLPERFQGSDKNQDGKLDQGEFAAALGG